MSTAQRLGAVRFPPSFPILLRVVARLPVDPRPVDLVREFPRISRTAATFPSIDPMTKQSAKRRRRRAPDVEVRVVDVIQQNRGQRDSVPHHRAQFLRVAAHEIPVVVMKELLVTLPNARVRPETREHPDDIGLIVQAPTSMMAESEDFMVPLSLDDSQRPRAGDRRKPSRISISAIAAASVGLRPRNLTDCIDSDRSDSRQSRNTAPASATNRSRSARP